MGTKWTCPKSYQEPSAKQLEQDGAVETQRPLPGPARTAPEPRVPPPRGCPTQHSVRGYTGGDPKGSLTTNGIENTTKITPNHRQKEFVCLLSVWAMRRGSGMSSLDALLLRSQRGEFSTCALSRSSFQKQGSTVRVLSFCLILRFLI